MEYPRLFRLDGIDVPGEFGSECKLRHTPACGSCSSVARLAEVERFHLHILSWIGANFVSCSPEYAITEAFRARLEREGFKGIAFKEMRTTVNPDCGDVPIASGQVPQLHWVS